MTDACVDVRPLGFSSVERCLHTALRQQSMPHAWLLHGPSGIGKAMLAWVLAKDCLCHDRDDEGRACGHCASCQMMQSQAHPDFHLLQRAWDEKKNTRRRDINIAQVRLLLDDLSLSTHAVGGFRVAVIDAIDELNPQAANALLKHLEEPLSGSVLLLVCHDLQRVLPTIRSRCVLQACTPLSEDHCRKVLQRMQPDTTSLSHLLSWVAGRPGLLAAVVENEVAMQQAEALQQMVEELAGRDLADLKQQLEQALKWLPHSLLMRILYAGLRPQLMLLSASHASSEASLDAMMDLLRWPEDVHRQTLRPLPSLFSRILQLRQALRQMNS